MHGRPRRRPPAGRSWVVAVALLAALAHGSGARAESTRSVAGDTAPRRIVDAFVAGSAAQVGELESMLHEGGLAAFEWRIQRPARLDPDALLEGKTDGSARCFVDLGSPRGVDVFVSDRNAERFLIRTVAPTPGGVIALEELAAAVEDALRDLLLGEEAFTRDEMRAWLASSDAPPEGAAPPPAPPEAPFPLRTAGFYGISTHSTHVPVVHGPGVAIALVDFGSRRHGALVVSAAYGLPRHTTDSPFDLVLRSVALRAGAESSGALGPRVRVGGRLSLGADFERVTASGGNGAYEPHPGTSTKSFVVSLAALASFRLGDDAALFAEINASVDPFAVQYDVETGAGTVRADERHRVRPGAALGLRMW